MAYSDDHIALAAEYALGTLDTDERALVETMMIVDPGIFPEKGYAPYDEGVKDDLFIKSSNGSVSDSMA